MAIWVRDRLWLGSGATEGNWGEAIRSVELPPLPDLREGELGSLILGDWIQLISPTMRDLSTTVLVRWEPVEVFIPSLLFMGLTLLYSRGSAPRSVPWPRCGERW